MGDGEHIANRVRELIAGERGISEKRMFGGVAFLLDGNLAVAASSHGGLMVRCPPEQTEQLRRKPHAGPFEMRGRAVAGWLRVEAEGVKSKRQLERWVARGVAHARSLPAK